MNNKRILYRSGIITMAIMLLLAVSACGGKAIDLMEYATVSIAGYDGYGEASFSFNYGAFEDALADALDADKNSAQFFVDGVIIEEGINLSLDKTSNLVNGDTVTLTVGYDDEVAKGYKLSFKGGTVTYDVTELTEVTKFAASDDDVIALLSKTTLSHWLVEIPVVPEKMRSFTITDTQVDYERNTARVEYSYDFDCDIAVFSVTGSVQYKYENDAWESTNIAQRPQIKEYTLSGVYVGTEWDIAGEGVSCNARYEITETAEGGYEALVTWSPNDESPNMAEQTFTIPLTNSFETARFKIINLSMDTSAEIRTADGRRPYIARALPFDFTNGGFSRAGEIALVKVSD